MKVLRAVLLTVIFMAMLSPIILIPVVGWLIFLIFVPYAGGIIFGRKFRSAKKLKTYAITTSVVWTTMLILLITIIASRVTGRKIIMDIPFLLVMFLFLFSSFIFIYAGARSSRRFPRLDILMRNI